MRRSTALGIVAIPILAATAVAAPKLPKVCQLLTDASGDTAVGISGVGAPVQSSALDVLSADIASGAKSVVGVIRVRSLRSDSMTSVGSQYTLYFTVGEAEWRFQAKRQTGSRDTFMLRPPGQGIADTAIDGKFDEATNSVTFTVPRKAVPELKNFKVSGLRVVNALNPPGTAVDSGESTKAYVDLQPSCVSA